MPYGLNYTIMYLQVCKFALSVAYRAGRKYTMFSDHVAVHVTPRRYTCV
jgi:hypothetical protein